jgi:hypothetical protein
MKLKKKLRREVVKSASLLVCLLVLCPLSTATAESVEFTDGAFVPGDWFVIEHEIGGGGDGSASQVLTGGSPGAYREVTTAINAWSGERRYWAFNFKTSAVFDPSSQGAISTIDYYESSKAFSSSQSIVVGLKQGSDLYAAGLVSGFSGTTWTDHSSLGLLPEDFNKAIPGGFDLGSHPDFGSSAEEITFGFARGRGSPVGGPYSESVGAIDNFRVVVNFTPVDVPALAGGGLACISLLIGLTGFLATRLGSVSSLR